MPPNSREARPQLSVLDRLLDDEPKKREEVQPTAAQTVRQLKDALRRDLEWLLNTRSYPEEIG
jgi:type VI secretion system protein ImpF